MRPNPPYLQQTNPNIRSTRATNLLARVPAATIGLIGRFAVIPIQEHFLKHPLGFQEKWLNTVIISAKAQGSEFFDALGWYVYISTAIEYLFPQWAYKHQGAVRLLGLTIPPAIDLLLESGIIPLFPYDPQIKKEVLASLIGVSLSLIMEKLLISKTRKLIND